METIQVRVMIISTKLLKDATSVYVVGNKSLAFELSNHSQFYSQKIRARHLSLFKLRRAYSLRA